MIRSPEHHASTRPAGVGGTPANDRSQDLRGLQISLCTDPVHQGTGR